ncbi:MAG: putative rane protein [Symbiobacteriaceae bacterium]|nr:putative rane protein [Symbiobacteriaceae bacterium]
MILWWVLLCWNLFVFATYALDKVRAKKGWRRTPERTLLWIAALGGGAGACLGIYWVRHKTKKPRFAWGVPAMLALQVIALGWGWSRGWW